MKKDIMIRKLIKALVFLKDGNGIHLHNDVFLCGKKDKVYGFKSIDNELYVETRSDSNGYPIQDMDKDDLDYIFYSGIYNKILNREYIQTPLSGYNEINDTDPN